MAGLVQVNLKKTGQEIYNKCIKNSIRFYASPSKLKKNKYSFTSGQKFDSIADSLASKGFLRSTKSYKPPENIANQINEICIKVGIKKTANLCDFKEKFQILEACFNNFQHGIPNSQLHEINTIDDIVKFYETPVDTTVPLDAMKTMKLPENVHIQYDYVRFNSNTDTKFNGQTAFPKSSTLVTGLKYRNKYIGNVAKRSWP